MKKFKKLVCAIIAVAMVITMIPSIPVQAAKAEKCTIYIGEYFSWSNYSEVLSVKCSNKKVLSAKKDKDHSYKINLVPKKTGTATVTVKTKGIRRNDTHTIKITVKKPNLQTSIKDIGGGYVLVKIKNNTSQSFDNAKYTYTIKDKSGEVLYHKEDVYASNLASKQTVFKKFYVGDMKDMSESLSKVKVTELGRSLDYTYKNVDSKKFKVSVKDKFNEDDKYGFTLKLQNKTNHRLAGHVYIFWYDDQNRLLEITDKSVSLREKEVNSSQKPYIYSSKYTNPNYDHYKIISYAYAKIRK